MKELCIIRHGLAGNGMIDERRDEKRPLTAQGKAKMMKPSQLVEVSEGTAARGTS